MAMQPKQAESGLVSYYGGGAEEDGGVSTTVSGAACLARRTTLKYLSFLVRSRREFNGVPNRSSVIEMQNFAF